MDQVVVGLNALTGIDRILTQHLVRFKLQSGTSLNALTGIDRILT